MGRPALRSVHCGLIAKAVVAMACEKQKSGVAVVDGVRNLIIRSCTWLDTIEHRTSRVRLQGGDIMRNLFWAVLLAASISNVASARATGRCGPGCHTAFYGGCVVNGWASTARVRNECPVGTRPRPRCPNGYSWKFGACFMSK